MTQSISHLTPNYRRSRSPKKPLLQDLAQDGRKPRSRQWIFGHGSSLPVLPNMQAVHLHGEWEICLSRWLEYISFANIMGQLSSKNKRKKIMGELLMNTHGCTCNLRSSRSTPYLSFGRIVSHFTVQDVNYIAVWLFCQAKMLKEKVLQPSCCMPQKGPEDWITHSS